MNAVFDFDTVYSTSISILGHKFNTSIPGKVITFKYHFHILISIVCTNYISLGVC